MSTAPAESAVALDGAVLLTRCAQGDASALGVLFDRHHVAVYRVLARLRGSDLDVDDLVQTTFLALPAAARNYDPSHSPLGFVLGVAVHHARRERRRIFRRLSLWRAHGWSLELDASAQDPERVASARQQLAAFAVALHALPAAQRETLVLVEIEGLSGEDAARSLGIPVNTLWTRLHYARASLREALDHGRRQ